MIAQVALERERFQEVGGYQIFRARDGSLALGGAIQMATVPSTHVVNHGGAARSTRTGFKRVAEPASCNTRITYVLAAPESYEDSERCSC
ncbi:hypothetical protein N9L68_04260 [bacterium]|nr:hypothetical protein [bacterium]